MIGNDKAMLLGLISAADPRMAQVALMNLVGYVTNEDIQTDEGTILEVIAQSLVFGYALIDPTAGLSDEDLIERFRQQLEEE